jgi:hypothetical protein
MNIKGTYDNGYNFIYDETNTAWYPNTCTHDGYYNANGYMWTSSVIDNYNFNGEPFRFEFGDNWCSIGGYSYEDSRTYNTRCMLDEGFIDARLPEVVSDEVVVLNSQSAKALGYVNSQGESDITARGFVWSKQEYPKLRVDISIEVAPGDEGFISKFEAVIDGLDPGSTYYIRPYATSALSTGYGKPMKIKTKDGGSSEDVGRDDDFEW